MGLKNVLFGLALILLLFFFIPIRIDKSSDDIEKQFTDYIQQYNKSYSNETVYQHHFKAFQKSLEAVEKLNSHRKHNRSAYYGLTKFSDMTPKEFLNKHLQLDLYERMLSRGMDDSKEYDKKHHHRVHTRSIKLKKQLPLKIDWRDKGVVTKVNNQKLCGACWAFSTVENMESMYAIKYGQLKRLSVQQLIDCARYNNDGCEGGDSCNLLHWLKDFNITVYDANEYPMHWKDEQCQTLNNIGVQIDKFACQRLVGDEDYILSTLAHVGPVAVAINALTWQYYIGGVIQFHCGSSPKLLNHAVQIVGYDLSAEIPHYIVRNSWGEDFGEHGYLYIAIGENLCGLANEVSVLTVL